MLNFQKVMHTNMDVAFSENSWEEPNSKKSLLQWQDDEKERFLDLFQKHGRDWAAIADDLPRKTDKQCRNYYQNYKHKLGLLDLMEKQK
mmetsp:Transcript_38927/g.37247  ORF Transcript_38927/g.37247 Transcript_38927/m.37247 type:complete len:89 (-) Transcript_38927:8-274(-)